MANNKNKDNEKYPLHCRKIPLKEDIIIAGMQKIMEEQGYLLDSNSALDMFKVIIGNLIGFLYRNPGFYFQLDMIDIDSKKDNFLIIKRSSQYSKDTVTPLSIFNHFVGENRARNELEKCLDKFAESLIGKREDIIEMSKVIKEDIISNYVDSRQMLKEIDDAINNNKLAIARQIAIDTDLELKEPKKAIFVNKNILDSRKQKTKKALEEDKKLIEKKDLKFPDDLLDT